MPWRRSERRSPSRWSQVMEEQMCGPCTAEVAAFDRFIDFLELRRRRPGFDLVIFDTAPTGHTLRLLELPAEWSRSIDEPRRGSGQTCIGPAAAIQDAKHKYERALATMRDASPTTFIFVLQPEATAIKETRRAIGELGKLGIHTHRADRQRHHPAGEQADSLFAERRRDAGSGYLAQIEADLPLPIRAHVAARGRDQGRARACARWRGCSSTDRLREATRSPTSGYAERPAREATEPSGRERDARARRRQADDLLRGQGRRRQDRGVLHHGACGWLAGAIETLLLTTDPAAHLGDVLGMPVGDEPAPVDGVPNLWATKIDPKAAADAYKARILADARERGRPESAIAVMAEELDSPCTEEIAAFDKFIEYASQDDWEVVVFDTAPTGHTLRLLELPVDWSKQLDVKVFASVDTVAADDVAKQRFGEVIDMMRDPSRARSPT